MAIKAVHIAQLINGILHLTYLTFRFSLGRECLNFTVCMLKYILLDHAKPKYLCSKPAGFSKAVSYIIKAKIKFLLERSQFLPQIHEQT